MSKAEEKALKAYPILKGSDMTTYSINKKNELRREGYMQAEKDLALTWGDVQLIDTLILELAREEESGVDWGDSEKFYGEVLRRFREMKNK